MANDVLRPLENKTVLIPGGSVLTTVVRLPKMHHSALRRAVPFALEERLVQNIEDCFFAIGETDADGNTPVAVIEKKRFERYLEMMSEKHWEVDVVLPDYLALPYEENAWTVWRHDAWVSVRTGLYSGFSIEEDNFDTMKLFYDEQESKECIEVSDVSIISAPMNLLQGEYRPRKHLSNIQSLWRNAIYAFSALVFTLFASQGIQYFYFQHKSKQLDQINALLYHRIFPKTNTMLSPRVTVDRLLQRLQHSAGSQKLINSLNKLGSILSHDKNLTLVDLEYKDEYFMLTVQSKKLNSIARFSRALSEKGWAVNERNLKNQKDSVMAVLEIRHL